MSNLFYALWRCLDDHKEWKIDRYRITNIKSGISLWIANGAWFLDTEPIGSVGILERHILWPRVKRMIRNHYVRRLT